MKRIWLAPVFAYRRWLSPILPSRCKYEPSCSTYTVQAVERFGVLRGTVLACWRILRCNPFSHGGFDPVRETFTLKVGPMDPADYHGETTPR
ncbi:MAG: membrane protein insertion efficiency factor YidD [Solirubrobacterales bacterium]